MAEIAVAIVLWTLISVPLGILVGKAISRRPVSREELALTIHEAVCRQGKCVPGCDWGKVADAVKSR